MDTSTRAPGYDLFKLVVAILLLLLFICLLLWIPANAPQPETPTSTPFFLTATPTANETPTSAPPTELSPSSPTEESSALTATPPPSLPTLAATETSSNTATPTPFSAPSPTATALPRLAPTSTGTPVIEATVTTVTPIVDTPSGADVCEAAMSRSRLQLGGNATILRRLNFRSSPGIQNNWLQTNLPGTQVDVIDGPVCLPHFIGAYVWWQIRLPDGQVGWSAEASLLGRFYFMEPNP